MQSKTKKRILVAGVPTAMLAILLVIFLCYQTIWAPKPEPVTTASMTTATTTENKFEGIEHESWEALKKKYPDTVGYLQIPGTDIKEVTVQGKDNDYYLRRSASGEYRYRGCYYVDYRCKLSGEMSQNTTIYGHNIDNVNEFGQLRKFRDIDFYKKNPVLKFDTPDGPGEWKIFSVFLTNTKGADGVIFNYREPNYKTGEEFLTFTERAKRRSLINCPVDILPDDKILTLSTCTYELKDWRLVVMARKTRPLEDKTVDISKAVKNNSPLYPEAWYKKYGGTRPSFADEPLLK